MKIKEQISKMSLGVSIKLLSRTTLLAIWLFIDFFFTLFYSSFEKNWENPLFEGENFLASSIQLKPYFATHSD